MWPWKIPIFGDSTLEGWRSYTISTVPSQVFEYNHFVILMGLNHYYVHCLMWGRRNKETFSQPWYWRSHYEVQILYPRVPKLCSWMQFSIILQYTTNLKVYTWWMSSFQDLGLYSTQTYGNGSTLQLYVHVFVHVEVHVGPRGCSRD